MNKQPAKRQPVYEYEYCNSVNAYAFSRLETTDTEFQSVQRNLACRSVASYEVSPFGRSASSRLETTETEFQSVQRYVDGRSMVS